MDLWLLACILLGKSINLLYIFMMRMIKVHPNLTSSLVYRNLFTKIFKKKGINLEGKSKEIETRQNYDIYYEKTIGVMHIVFKDGI